MYKNIVLAVLVMGSVAGGDFSLTDMICLSDSTGREVRIYGADTSVMLQKVVRVIYRTGGYLVTFKDGDTLALAKPPFTKVDVSIKGEESWAKEEKAKESKDEQPAEKKADERRGRK